MTEIRYPQIHERYNSAPQTSGYMQSRIFFAVSTISAATTSPTVYSTCQGHSGCEKHFPGIATSSNPREGFAPLRTSKPALSPASH